MQALVIVPTRELGMQVSQQHYQQACACSAYSQYCLFVKVASVARMLAAKPTGFESVKEICTIMALLDGGMLKRHKTWLKVFFYTLTVLTSNFRHAQWPV